MIGRSLLVTRRSFCGGRQGFCRGGALDDLAHPDMRLAGGDKRANLDEGQIGFDQFGPECRIEVKDGNAGGPAAPQPGAPAQAQRLDRSRLRHLVE